MLIFFLVAALLLCTVAVGGTRLVTGKTSTTNELGILGATIGLFSGGMVGEKIGFGRVMISIFNPDLPERDFVTSFGAIGGGILNAFFLALLRGISMHSITLRGNAGDHVIITCHGRPDENDDWLDATIDVAAGAFSGRVSASLVTVDFARFRRELESLHQTLDGTATFETIERQLAIECVGNGRGGIGVTGMVEDRAGDGNQLKYQIDTDQTFLPALISQIRVLEELFPNKLHPNFPQ